MRYCDAIVFLKQRAICITKIFVNAQLNEALLPPESN